MSGVVNVPSLNFQALQKAVLQSVAGVYSTDEPVVHLHVLPSWFNPQVYYPYMYRCFEWDAGNFSFEHYGCRLDLKAIPSFGPAAFGVAF